MEDEKAEQQKMLLAIMGIMAACIFCGMWCGTQFAARALQYNHDLGGLALGDMVLYWPWQIFSWRRDAALMAVPSVAAIMKKYGFLIFVGGFAGAGISCLVSKQYKTMTSHGTARFANKQEIKDAQLDALENGVVCGRNPYTHQLMLHDGPEHILLLAPTRSGKGVGVITPTGIIWKHSIFFFDPKAELWNMTSGWRKLHHHQKVLKFEPLCKDGSGARWNPFAEVNFQSTDEMDDVTTIAEMMCKTGEKTGGAPFWENSAVALVKGVIMHLLYKHYQEKKELPNLSDVMSFLSSPDLDTDHLFAGMKIYPHISPKEFLESKEEEPELDAEGRPVFEDGQPKMKLKHQYHNPLKEIYGEYIPDLGPFKAALGLLPNTADWEKVQKLDDLRQAILAYEKENHKQLDWSPPDIRGAADKNEINAQINAVNNSRPWYQLLVHPKVAESAANMLNGAKETRASIMQTTQTALAIYQNPLIKANTAVSDFTVRDLLRPGEPVSLYLVLQPNDVDKLRPLTRLFISTMMAKLVRDMDFGDGGGTTNIVNQRLLLLLDEFPQLGKMDQIEKQLAICAGYGVKLCIIAQNVGQLNQLYTKDNGFAANCHVQIYFTPADNDSAKMLSDKLGEATITTTSVSSNGRMFEKNNSVSENARKLMTPDEAGRMSSEKELVFVTGHRPIFADKIRFYKEPYFKKRVATPAPPYSDACTKVKDYQQLFEIHAAERKAQAEKKQKVLAARKKEAKKALQLQAGKDNIECAESCKALTAEVLWRFREQQPPIKVDTSLPLLNDMFVLSSSICTEPEEPYLSRIAQKLVKAGNRAAAKDCRKASGGELLRLAGALPKVALAKPSLAMLAETRKLLAVPRLAVTDRLRQDVKDEKNSVKKPQTIKFSLKSLQQARDAEWLEREEKAAKAPVAMPAAAEVEPELYDVKPENMIVVSIQPHDNRQGQDRGQGAVKNGAEEIEHEPEAAGTEQPQLVLAKPVPPAAEAVAQAEGDAEADRPVAGNGLQEGARPKDQEEVKAASQELVQNGQTETVPERFIREIREQAEDDDGTGSSSALASFQDWHKNRKKKAS